MRKTVYERQDEVQLKRHERQTSHNRPESLKTGKSRHFFAKVSNVEFQRVCEAVYALRGAAQLWGYVT